MAGLIHASIPVRGSHDVCNHHSSDIYRSPSAYESYSTITAYSPKQRGGDSSSLLNALTPAPDVSVDVTNNYSCVSTGMGSMPPAYPMLVTTAISPYENTNPPSLYAPNGVSLSNPSACNYSYPFGLGTASSLFNGSSPFSPPYMGLNQQDGSSPGINGRGRNSRAMSSETAKGNKKKVSRKAFS